MKDAGSGNPPAELLTALQDRQKAWADLNWKSVGFVKANRQFNAYDCVGGLFSQTHGRNFSMFCLPSATRTGAHTTTPLAFPVRNFILDVAEDLVVFLHEEELPSGFRRGNLYCRSTSTNEQHPACSSASTLSFESFQDNEESVFFTAKLDVADDVLFVTTREVHGVRIVIWNWKMGFLIYDSLDRLSSAIDELNVVQRDVFILTSRAGSGKILIYQISPTVACIPILITTLSLPKTSGEETLLFRVDSGQYQNRATPGALFLPNPTCRTYVFSISHSSSSEGWMLFVQSKTFLRFVHCQEDNLEVPWSEWGEQESRFIEKRIRGNWRRNVHGNRVIRMRKDPESTWIDVFDLSSSPSLASCSASGLLSQQQHFGSDNPTIIAKGDIFEEDVVTRLPYHVASRELRGQMPFACMIDEERVVAMEFMGNMLELMVHPF
ncbi:unnamed protein product [Cyclocybe aegerita]|uniref:Uncharacterized protein n=1 Tax=Cyclocybe aegerita TaxID=1973307 RepID=A0A8S0VR61_CYCAE|nr:unnamed protein product [Cyclocybe aegerita]